MPAQICHSCKQEFGFVNFAWLSSSITEDRIADYLLRSAVQDRAWGRTQISQLWDLARKR